MNPLKPNPLHLMLPLTPYLRLYPTMPSPLKPFRNQPHGNRAPT